jgi:hypothetical protein
MATSNSQLDLKLCQINEIHINYKILLWVNIANNFKVFNQWKKYIYIVYLESDLMYLIPTHIGYFNK